jgi:hypothetical protein
MLIGAPIAIDEGDLASHPSWRSLEWRGPRSYLVGGFERDPAPIQKQAEHIEPADHKHDFARDRLTVSVEKLAKRFILQCSAL